MHRQRWLLRVGLVLLIAATSACATTHHEATPPAPSVSPTPPPPPTLTFEEHSLRIPLTVQANGSVSLAEIPPLVGRIDLSPILAAEGMPAGPAATTVVQLMVHYGRFYVVADGFRSIWEITPQSGTATASYRRIAIPGGADPQPGIGAQQAAGAQAASDTQPGSGSQAVPAASPAPGAPSESGAKPVREARLSRYGSSQSSCLRLDRANGPPVFITSRGEATSVCP